MIHSPWRRASASTAASSSCVATKPVGLAGELMKIARVAGRHRGWRAARRSSRQRVGAALERDEDRRAPASVTAPAKFGQAGEGISASSPGADRQARGDFERVHAADGDEEALGREFAAARRRAVDARHVARDRLAQLGDAALMGVEGLAAVERGLGRVDDEARRRPVALADPQRDQALPAAAIVEHFDDAARRRRRASPAEFRRANRARSGGASGRERS